MIYLYEAKIRFCYIFLYFSFTWVCSYFFCNQFIYLLTLPLKAAYLQNNPNALFHLIFTELTEIFFSQTKLATYLTFIFLLPILFYQIWLFVKPGLYIFEKSTLLFNIFLSLFFTFLSLVFTFFFILPSACKFFLSFETITGFNIYLEAKMDKYISFILNIFLSCYFFFQLPIFFFIFFQLGLLRPGFLIKHRRFSYLFFFFFSFFIVPPNLDFFSLFFFLPIFPFYEFLLFSLFWRRALSYERANASAC